MREVWNIVIISNKDEDYDLEYRNLLDEMTSVEVHNKIRFLVYEFEKEPANTKIFEYDFNNQRVDLPTANCADLFNKEHMVHFFKTNVFKEDTQDISNKYIVITWGHGAGLGIFAKIEKIAETKAFDHHLELAMFEESVFNEAKNSAREIVARQAFLSANSIIPVTDLGSEMVPVIDKLSLRDDLESSHGNSERVRDFKNDLKSLIPEKLKMITGNDLNFIFANSLPTQVKIDVLITINCYTQCFEFGNSLKDTVNLIVAPQTMIPFEGIHYREIFAFIENYEEDHIDSQGIANVITHSFWTKYLFTKTGKAFIARYKDFPLERTSFSSNNLNFYSEIESVIGEVGFLLKELKKKSEDIKFIIINARKRCQDPTAAKDYGMIDFTVFFQNLMIESNFKRQSFSDELKESIKKLNGLYSRFVKDLRRQCCISMCMSQAQSYIQFDGNVDQRKSEILISSPSPFFLSIFFPGTKHTRMIELLRSGIPPTVNRANPHQYDYSDWMDFVTTLYSGTHTS